MTQPLADPPYAHLLKRRPVQVRSAARVDAILDATARLLSDGDLDAVTVRAIATVAGVPTGTIYQFFGDKDAVLQALAVRYVAATLDVLDDAFAGGDGTWPVTVARIVDGYADMVAGAPAMRTLWLGHAMDATTLSLAQQADDEIAVRLQERLARQAGVATEAGGARRWRLWVGVVDGFLRSAFADDPRGDADVLAEARRVATLHAADILGVTVLLPPRRGARTRPPGRPPK